MPRARPAVRFCITPLPGIRVVRPAAEVGASFLWSTRAEDGLYQRRTGRTGAWSILSYYARTQRKSPSDLRSRVPLAVEKMRLKEDQRLPIAPFIGTCNKHGALGPD